ncbi:MAG: RagB/SusD family nutrient uptake outer membrane protein, partial [Bacteroidota bacterium]
KIVGSLVFLVFAALTFNSCEEDYTNPGAVTEDQVLNSPDGLIALGVGVQRRYSVGRQSPAYTRPTAAGFTTQSLRLINPGNVSENDVSLGYDELDADNAIVNNLWSQSLIIRDEAQSVLDNLDIIPTASTAAGLQAYVSIFYALANETLYLFFEQAPTETAQDAAFKDRTALLSDNVTVLQAAAAALASNAPSGEFLGRIPGAIDLGNTVQALLARNHLLLADYPAAISAADAVDRSATSLLQYDDITPNPIAFVSILTNNVYQPLDLTLGLPADLQPQGNDQRLPFYFEDLMPDMQDFRAAGFYNANGAAIPIYWPGEMDLIIAEANARNNQIPAAIDALNEVLTKLPGDDPLGVGAALDPYSGAQTQDAVLDAIYTNRALEMMFSGFRLEDSRRFNRPGPLDANPERNRNFYPYPNSERDSNPNTPPNPDI